LYSPRNLQQNPRNTANQILDVSLHYPAKDERPKLAKFCCIWHNNTCWMFIKLTNKICKTTCIIAVKLNAQNVFLHTNSRAETFAPLVNSVIDDEIVRNDARYRSSAASVHWRHKLARPVATFLPVVCTQPGSNLCCLVEKFLLKWMQVSRFRRLI